MRRTFLRFSELFQSLMHIGVAYFSRYLYSYEASKLSIFSHFHIDVAMHFHQNGTYFRVLLSEKQVFSIVTILGEAVKDSRRPKMSSRRSFYRIVSPKLKIMSQRLIRADRKNRSRNFLSPSRSIFVDVLSLKLGIHGIPFRFTFYCHKKLQFFFSVTRKCSFIPKYG